MVRFIYLLIRVSVISGTVGMNVFAVQGERCQMAGRDRIHKNNSGRLRSNNDWPLY